MLQGIRQYNETAQSKIKLILNSKLVRHANKPFNYVLNQVPILPDGFIQLTTPVSESVKTSFAYKAFTKNQAELLARVRGRYESASPPRKFVPIVRTHCPQPRDGHSTHIVADRFMVVFGGDRHHMPFNDVVILDLSKELDDHQFLFDE